MAFSNDITVDDGAGERDFVLMRHTHPNWKNYDVWRTMSAAEVPRDFFITQRETPPRSGNPGVRTVNVAFRNAAVDGDEVPIGHILAGLTIQWPNHVSLSDAQVKVAVAQLLSFITSGVYAPDVLTSGQWVNLGKLMDGES